jgi:hypothetical protein
LINATLTPDFHADTKLSSTEEPAEGIDLGDAPFRCGGQVGLDDGEVGEAAEGAPASAGGTLGDLDRPDRPFRFVVGVIRMSE